MYAASDRWLSCILRGMRPGTFDVVYNSPLTLAHCLALCFSRGANVDAGMLTLSWDCNLDTFDNLWLTRFMHIRVD